MLRLERKKDFISIIIHLSLLTMTLTVLILAECRTPVTYEII